MPKRGGHNYYVLYYNNEGEVNTRRKRGKRPKPTSAETLDFLEKSLTNFKSKYGVVAKTITMSKETKGILDARVKGKGFLKRKTIVISNKDLGFRTIHLSEIREKK